MSDDLAILAVVAMIALSVGGIAFVLLHPLFSSGSRANRRMAKVSGTTPSLQRSGRDGDTRDQRRKVVQETLKQIEESEKQRKRRLTLRTRLEQAGLEISVRGFWLMSIACGIAVGLVAYFTVAGPVTSAIAGLVGVLGLPRWYLSFRRNRRQTIFLLQLPDAVDIVVRGLKAGLPVNDAVRIIATEMGPPVGPEFLEIVEGQKVGIPLDQGLERLYERMPLAEVNFIAIVIGIQQRTGGNLSEALSNLSKVLRDRKKMKGKIKAMSQEAKSSAAIIGALPPAVLFILYLVRPDYISTLWIEPVGQVMLIASAVWMLMGVLVMRKMINFDF